MSGIGLAVFGKAAAVPLVPTADGCADCAGEVARVDAVADGAAAGVEGAAAAVGAAGAACSVTGAAGVVVSAARGCAAGALLSGVVAGAACAVWLGAAFAPGSTREISADFIASMSAASESTESTDVCAAFAIATA